jgi:hypothetical protein
MKGEWNHDPYEGIYYLQPKTKHGRIPAYVETTGTSRHTLVVDIDPRTGKPWRSMKAAREWFDEVADISAIAAALKAGKRERDIARLET